jgi:hypothetical protein
MWTDRLVATCSEKQQQLELPTIDANQAHQLVGSGHNYIDVR